MEMKPFKQFVQRMYNILVLISSRKSGRESGFLPLVPRPQSVGSISRFQYIQIQLEREV